MILPKKHLSLDESLFGFGAYLLGNIGKNSNIDRLWRNYLSDYKNNIYSVKFTFDQYIITVDYLFAINAVEINQKGELRLCS